MNVRWRFGIIAGLFLAVFSLYPQMKMIYLRGAEWNGHYAYNDIDEVAYAAYLKALIDGRPRKNDPYTGRDDSPESPQPESLFSIQFAAPYSIALPARLLGVPVTWAMTISGAVAAFLTALVIFWLIRKITGDDWFAMAGSLVVLAGGAIFAGEGAIGEILDTSYAYPYFPGFRRYVPAMAFPAFFFMVGLVWKLVSGQWSVVSGQSTNNERRTMDSLWIALAVLAFAYTVFSYFYVWTTAVAWLGCVGLVWLIVRPDGVWKDVRSLAILAGGCVAALVPYAYLLSLRSHTMDDVQMVVKTRALDLTRPPELIAIFVLIALAGCVSFRLLELRDRAVLFTASLALVVIVVFNQQVITGQSLQPIHYQVFIGNYVAGLALVLMVGLLWRRAGISGRFGAKIAAVVLTLVAADWGFVECHYTVRILDDVNVIRDEALPVARRLTELGASDPDRYKKVVLHLGIAEADDLPTVAPQSVLWARHQHVFAGVTTEENKERYYQLLYYQGVRGRQLADGMKHGNDFVSMIALFGWGRHTDRLNSESKPLTFGEIEAEAMRYDRYARDFDPASNGAVRLDYLVAPNEPNVFFDNIDKWYLRDAGEAYGKYVLFTLTQRQP
ncbi:MAG: hypothetical protein KBD94_12080 [Pyrinomonadaceae bacterium]|nr:hypothetical protein [Pyrinomonadaceae bacterium]